LGQFVKHLHKVVSPMSTTSGTPLDFALMCIHTYVHIYRYLGRHADQKIEFIPRRVKIFTIVVTTQIRKDRQSGTSYKEFGRPSHFFVSFFFLSTINHKQATEQAVAAMVQLLLNAAALSARAH
jgi:hypothetical protein